MTLNVCCNTVGLQHDFCTTHYFQARFKALEINIYLIHVRKLTVYNIADVKCRLGPYF